MNQLVETAVETALGEKGVHEVGGNNHGQRIEQYLARVHLKPGDAWCYAGAYWAFDEAAIRLGVSNPLPCVGSVHKAWDRASPALKSQEPAVGALFCHDAGKGKGHVGFVLGIVPGKKIITWEANTNEDGARDSTTGDTWLSHIRVLDYVNLGFISVPS